MSGTHTQTWVMEQIIPAMLHASHGDNTICKAVFFHQNKEFAKLRDPWTPFSFPVATGKGCLPSPSYNQNDSVCSSLSLFP